MQAGIAVLKAYLKKLLSLIVKKACILSLVLRSNISLLLGAS